MTDAPDAAVPAPVPADNRPAGLAPASTATSAAGTIAASIHCLPPLPVV